MADIDTLCSALSYMSASDIRHVRRAHRFADCAHKGQVRRSGEPYISHPTRVAEMLAYLEPDKETVLAALLHDVIEDTDATEEQLQEEFGSSVCHIVQGVSKLANFKADNYQQAQAENFQKMALAMVDDIRVIIVKIVDRYHNMLTIHHLPVVKQKRIAQETLHVYAPIANRLGMDTFYRNLQDMAFKVLYPMRFNMIDRAVKAARIKSHDYVEEIKQTFEQVLAQTGINGRVEGRRKHLAGIYFKMAGGAKDSTDPYSDLDYKRKRVSFSNIMDVHGFRIITDSADNCYLLLGQVHRVFKPYPNRFKDYIAIPKVNGYQSLHTTVMGVRAYPIEVQIRTHEMHRIAQNGIASHRFYKAGKTEGFASVDSLYGSWRQKLITMKNESGNSQEFLNNVRLDLFPSEIYVFSPTGDIFPLPKGATPVDFAYAVHTDIGNHCVGCDVDGEAALLSMQLVTGQTVNIMTREDARPDPDWRNFVVTAKALSAMGYYFRHLRQSDAVKLGKQLLDNALINYDTSLARLHSEQIDQFLQEDSYYSLDDLLERIGTGKLYPGNVASRLLKTTEQQLQQEPLVVSEDNLSVLSFGRCCMPVKGDAVSALMKADMGMVIHRIGCRNIKKQRKDLRHHMPAAWQKDAAISLPVKLRMEIINNRELIAAIADSISSLGCTIQSMETADRDINVQVINFVLFVDNRHHLALLLKRLRRLADVRHVSRI